MTGACVVVTGVLARLKAGYRILTEGEAAALLEVVEAARHTVEMHLLWEPKGEGIKHRAAAIQRQREALAAVGAEQGTTEETGA